jgi:hypothetical protein
MCLEVIWIEGARASFASNAKLIAYRFACFKGLTTKDTK